MATPEQVRHRARAAIWRELEQRLSDSSSPALGGVCARLSMLVLCAMPAALSAPTVVAPGTPWERTLEKLPAQAKTTRAADKALLSKLKKAKGIDDEFHRLHDEAFEHIDCLTCANCCRTTPPRIVPKDVDRLARALKMKPGDFSEAHVATDAADGELMLRHADEGGCPFGQRQPLQRVRRAAGGVPLVSGHEPAQDGDARQGDAGERWRLPGGERHRRAAPHAARWLRSGAGGDAARGAARGGHRRARAAAARRPRGEGLHAGLPAELQPRRARLGLVLRRQLPRLLRAGRPARRAVRLRRQLGRRDRLAERVRLRRPRALDAGRRRRQVHEGGAVRRGPPARAPRRRPGQRHPAQSGARK